MRQRIRSLVICLLGVFSVCVIGCKSDAPEPQQNSTPTPISAEAGNITEGMALIPGGEFSMGTDNPDSEMDERPVHKVFVDDFYIDKYEVTNGEFKKFVDAHPEWQKGNWWKSNTGIDKKFHDGDYLKDWNGNNYPEGEGNHPVGYVSWYAAMAYANWVGKRLPTEAEWEKAARGGLEGLEFPWGNTINPSNASFPPHGGLNTPIGIYPANGYGLYDMVGNMGEWCLDAHNPNFYQNSPYQNPISGADNINQVVDNYIYVTNSRITRGGACCNDPLHLRVSRRDRHNADCSHEFNGFRCAMSVNSD